MCDSVTLCRNHKCFDKTIEIRNIEQFQGLCNGLVIKHIYFLKLYSQLASIKCQRYFFKVDFSNISGLLCDLPFVFFSEGIPKQNIFIAKLSNCQPKIWKNMGYFVFYSFNFTVLILKILWYKTQNWDIYQKLDRLLFLCDIFL